MVCIDMPSWKSFTTYVTCVSCTHFLELPVVAIGKIQNEAFIIQKGCEGLWQPTTKHCLAPFVTCCLSYLNRTKCNRFTYSNKIFEESNKKMCLWNIQSHLSYCGIAADYGCCTTAHASHIHAESFPNSGRKKNTAYMKGDTTSEL